jgi:hypothetical protein
MLLRERRKRHGATAGWQVIATPGRRRRRTACPIPFCRVLLSRIPFRYHCSVTPTSIPLRLPADRTVRAALNLSGSVEGRRLGPSPPQPTLTSHMSTLCSISSPLGPSWAIPAPTNSSSATTLPPRCFNQMISPPTLKNASLYPRFAASIPCRADISALPSASPLRATVAGAASTTFLTRQGSRSTTTSRVNGVA